MRGVVSTAGVLGVVAAAALALGACGDDDSGGDDADARAELIAALSPEAFEAVESGVLDLGVNVEVTGDEGGTVDASLRGPFTEDGSAALDGSVEVDDADQDLSFDGNLTVTQDNLYFGSGDQLYELGADRYAHLKSASKAAGTDPAAVSLGFSETCRTSIRAAGGNPSVCDDVDPESWISSASDEGTEDVGGAETQHLHGELDVEPMLSDLIELSVQTVPASQRQGLEAFGDPDRFAERAADFVEEASIDVYRGTEDGITRRGGFEVKADLRGTEVSFGFDMAVEELNEPQTVTAPQGAQPIESLRSRIPFFFQPLFDCFLDARTAADINRCGAQAGSFGGGTVPSSS